VSPLEIDRLVVRYGRIEAVKGISLRVEAGEMVALIGANGAGKTTTLLAVSGALPVASGTVKLEGSAITGLKAHRIARRGLLQVIEGRAIFGGLTVRENLIAGSCTRSDTQRLAQDLERLLDRFPVLQERLDQPGSTLSGGEQQMLAIARALIGRPRVLMLDEPSMGLAPLMAETVLGLLAELNREGLAVLLVEQNAARALALSHRAYVMAHGEVVASGSVSSLLADERVLAAYLGSSVSSAAQRGAGGVSAPAS
jgi:branched-chain amino acid transport system ATP-binding protein